MIKCWKVKVNMHELAICQSLMNQVEQIVNDNNAQRATSITIGMGPLSGVEDQLLKNAYPLASVGSVGEGAELIIQLLPLRVKCNTCDTESDVLPNKLVCKQCGDWKTTVISGDELMLMSVELEKKPQAVSHIN